MSLRWVPPGVAAFLAVSVIAGQAAFAKTESRLPATETRVEPGTADARRTLLVRLVENREPAAEERRRGETTEREPDREEPGEVLVIDGEEIARDVEEAVGDAVSEAMNALRDIEEDIRTELDGERLDALSEKYRERLDEAREQLRDIGDRLSEHAAELEVRVTRAGEKAVEAAREAGEALRETRVIVIRKGRDAKVEIEKDEEGRTIVIIEGEDVKVITPEKPDEQADQPPE